MTLEMLLAEREIYRALVDLRERGLVSVEVQPQEKLPARKVYAVTAEGRAELAAWTASAPQLPQRRHALLIQLAWADALPAQALDDLLAYLQGQAELVQNLHAVQTYRDRYGVK